MQHFGFANTGGKKEKMATQKMRIKLRAYEHTLIDEACRRIVEKGADLVVCQHSHCIGSEEIYKGKKILYGQGNFIFNKRSKNIVSKS